MSQDRIDAARLLGTTLATVNREPAGAIRRFQPDACEVYGVISGRRFVARSVGEQSDWIVSVEAPPQPWER